MPPIDRLFNSFSLKSLSIANRIVMAPMSRYHSPDNIPSEASAAYYQRRAAGGVGLILTEGTCPNHIAANGYENVPYFHGEERLAGWKKVAQKSGATFLSLRGNKFEEKLNNASNQAPVSTQSNEPIPF